jgi:hypothetical protein
LAVVFGAEPVDGGRFDLSWRRVLSGVWFPVGVGAPKLWVETNCWGAEMGYPKRSTHGAFISMAFMLSCLVACGGGSGSGSGAASGGGPVVEPPPATSGLVPAAGAVGVVVEADAGTLRVLRPGASWIYAGQVYASGVGGAAQGYSNTVSHASAAVGVTETSTDALHEGVSSENVQVAAGIVKSPVQVQPLPNAAVEQIDAIELRSPVRVGDQYTLYDRRFADGGVDLDGDRINEALDIAVWTKVVGTEVINLPQRLGVNSIRVDTTLARRIRYSVTGGYSKVTQLVQRVWYAKGIGIVQTEFDQPHDTNAALRHITRERLDSWNGLTQGLGALPLQPAMVPIGASAGKPLERPFGAAGFADHAVAMGSISGAQFFEGIALTSIDASGRVTASTDHRGVNGVGSSLVRLGADLRLLTLTDVGIVAVGFDAHGRNQTQSARVLVPKAAALWSNAQNDWFRVAVAGNRLWLLTLQACDPLGSSTMLCNLMLHTFNDAGQAVGTPQLIVPGVSPSFISSMRLEGGADRVLASWQRGGLTSVWQFAVADTASGVLLRTGSLGDLGAFALVYPAASDAGLAMVYPSDATFGGLAAVALDATFEPIRGTPGSLNQELVSKPWMEPASLSALATESGKLWFATSLTTGAVDTTLSELRWSVGTAASTGSLQLLGRLRYLDSPFLVPLSDRVLVIGSSNFAMAATAVWRAP